MTQYKHHGNFQTGDYYSVLFNSTKKHPMPTPNAISTTQPAIGYSYKAFYFGEGRNEPAEVLIVYRGYENGKYIIYNGKHLYRAERSSPEDQEPVFTFDDSNLVEGS